MVNHPHLGISEIFGQLLKNLLVGIHRAILAHKEHLPAKSKKFNYPAILWFFVPLHVNFPDNWNTHLIKFNQCLEKVVKIHPEMATLKLLKIWDQEDSSLVYERRYSAKGLSAFWASLDSAFRHWDTFVYTKNKGKAKGSSQNQAVLKKRSPSAFVQRENQKYKKMKLGENPKWRNYSEDDKEERRKLPQLPY